jgi:preprotein translocase subunit SecA
VWPANSAHEQSASGPELEPKGQAPNSNEAASQVQWPLHEEILKEMQKEMEALVDLHTSGEDSEEWNYNEIFESILGMHAAFSQVITKEHLASIQDRDELKKKLSEMIVQFYEAKCKSFEIETVRRAENIVTLRSIDTHWMEHIDSMSHLREQVAFSGYAQRDPKIEYQDQGFRRFQQLIATINSAIVRTLLQVDFAQFAPQVVLEEDAIDQQQMQTNREQIEGEITGNTGASRVAQQSGARPQGPVTITANPQDPMQARVIQRMQAGARQQQSMPQVGRNDPCPCGSGKKFKKCHGKDL